MHIVMIDELIEKWIVLLALLPWLIMLIGLFIRRRGRKTFHFKKVADWMTLSVIIAVYILARFIMGDGVGYYILMLILIMAIIYTIFEWRRNKDFMILPTLYKLWRLLFLVFIVLYIALYLIAIVLFIVGS